MKDECVYAAAVDVREYITRLIRDYPRSDLAFEVKVMGIDSVVNAYTMQGLREIHWRMPGPRWILVEE